MPDKAVAAPLFATKLHPPALHPRRVQRARLVNRLAEGLAAGHGLTLISAPAGFGKTTCAAEWLAGLDRPVSWLSLEAGDDEPLRFFRYFLAALQRLDGRLGRELEGVLRAGQLPPAETLTAALIDDLLLLEQPAVLVCDDFHTIQNAYILGVIERLVHQRLPGLHLVLVTREDPLLPLARLRANDRLTEIRAGDLRFSAGEAADFLRGTLGLALSAADAAALEQRTEGWAAGLQLAGLSMRGRSDPAAFIAALNGSHRFILSYLTEEVLARQSPEIQAFLQQTAILERMTGELCDALTGGSGSGALLERLFNANLFLAPLDDEQRWYRYHHLFADLLRSHTSRLPEAQLKILHQRAARWYSQAGLPGDAITHALAAGDYALAVEQVAQHAMRILTGGDVLVVEGWLQAIPPEQLAASVRANLAFGWLHLIRGRYAQAAERANLAEAGLAQAAGDQAQQVDEDVRDMQADLLALQANLANVQGRPAAGICQGQAALAQASSQAHYARGQAWLALGGAYRLTGEYALMVEAYQHAIRHSQAAGNVLGEVIAVAGLAMVAYQRGELRFARRTGAPLLERFQQPGPGGERSAAPPPITGTLYGALGMIDYQWNRLDAAREAFQHSLQLASLGGHNAGVVYSQLLLARLAQAEGDLAAAARATQAAAAGMQLGVPAWLRPDVIEQQVRLHLALGQPELAVACLPPGVEVSPDAAAAGLPVASGRPAAGGPAAERPAAAGGGSDLLALASLRLAVYAAEQDEGRAGPAFEQAARLLAGASAARRMGIVLPALLLRARLHARWGHTPAALADLAQAVALAEPEGYLRAFVDEGPQVVELLRAHLPHCEGRRAEYVKEILAVAGEEPLPGPPRLRGEGGREKENEPEAAWSSALLSLRSQVSAAAGPGDRGSSLKEPLSGREVEVLGLIAEGLKYEEIAERLVVSVNTVRYHVKTIYGKLAVNNRTQAIEVARAHKIIG